ncbi:hypothetical protein FEM03_01270 [Phragmitibacter flavus]|uniref:Beta-ketoacyl-[acyl-carrier-protein] synthase III C-terminal domain-containing protein n=1 Tax=Phragmitibacter flavus TaxID=2576071 RepID=A0A5R8KK85_9BACT|nr:3-oxoacyl-[acyl-carrier-protein] synthase III C-terminal domain-containing protein [Phragmitibacter flavus]TLD72733.1 hypothetical protein FEM03_01270 [Phragmitibacter flavus]
MNAPDIGIRHFATALPEQFQPLEALSTTSNFKTLREFGFDGTWIGDDAGWLGRIAAERALLNAALEAQEVDVLFWISALSGNHQCPSSNADEGSTVLHEFCYRGSWLQEQLNMDRATVCGIAQQGCAGMFSALRQARALLLAEPDISNVLCVGSDVFPPEAEREVLYNLISDAACACVLSREDIQYRWLGFYQISKGYYWDVPAKQSEIIAAYFPTAVLAIRKVLAQQGLQPTDIDLVIPTGVNRSSWPILMRLCGIPESRLFEPVKRFGHTVAADSFLMLEQAKQQGRLRPGMKLLLFAYGFGSSWSALLLETTHLIES